MRLLRLGDVDARSSDRLYRHPRFSALAVWLAAFAGDCAMLAGAVTGRWKPGYFFGPFVLLFLLLTRRFVTARFHPSNWLVRANDDGIFVQYRSYLNFHLPPEEASVVFLSYREIASARLVRERVETPDPSRPNTTQTQFLRYIELELAGDTAALADALDAERAEQAPVEKHVYGSSATLYRDYPVTMSAPPCLRIHWNVLPGPKAFLTSLRSRTVIADPVSLKADFADLRSVSPDEQRRRLRELAQRGQVVEAIYVARTLQGGSWAAAKELVDGLLRRRS